MHIAAAINPRMLSIHTRSDPRLVGPFSRRMRGSGRVARDSAPAARSVPPCPRPIARKRAIIFQIAELAKQIAQGGALLHKKTIFEWIKLTQAPPIAAREQLRDHRPLFLQFVDGCLNSSPWRTRSEAHPVRCRFSRHPIASGMSK